MAVQVAGTTVAVSKADRRRGTTLMLGSSRLTRVLVLVALVVFCALWLAPLVWAVLTSFKSETDAAAVPVTFWPENGWTLEAYTQVLSVGSLPVWLLNSLTTATAVTVLTVVICALAAYALSRLDFRGRRGLMVLTVAAILVPGQILLVPLYQEMQAFGLVDTFWGIVLPQVIAPVNVVVLKRFFDTVPVELEDAARIDGAGRLRVLWSVILPLSRPVLVAVTIFTFVSAWNNFLWPFIVTTDPALMTMPVGLGTVRNAYGIQYAQTMAAAVIAAAPLLVIFLFFQRQIIKGIATTGLGGQ
ncbi:carbohydrate ABC transporter permease [Allokutzneria sp. A3M-2-11 16]|uniref:carbohydrate ABC transporter permease n=1 Tax=Allokutzneria sp. A3M-2-11 16 TaxID=2962043 RepID=UPI0020B8A024|nr:carbohydrate ABC transporter permease [Allokutzneria sp. A3M-2-11 16]MCP3801962.1 carbohydrate ABC transporter permease [Allokutzneria sp. A3M-2-11 16]